MIGKERSKGNSLERYGYVWNDLNHFFKGRCPNLVTVDYTDDSTSKFHPSENRISLNMPAFKYNYITVLAHETSHLCLFHLTNGESNKEHFRFLDEGFASVIGAKIAGNLESYKMSSLAEAKSEASKGNVIFSKLQQWSDFFGTPPKSNGNAYSIGASFIFAITERYGEEKLFEFFVEVGESKDLTISFRKVFDLSLDDFERQWWTFLEQVRSAPIPQIVEIHPDFNAHGVPLGTKEIIIRFDVPMHQRVSIGTRCNDGICYRNAVWKDEKTKWNLVCRHILTLSFRSPHEFIDRNLKGLR